MLMSNILAGVGRVSDSEMLRIRMDQRNGVTESTSEIHLVDS